MKDDERAKRIRRMMEEIEMLRRNNYVMELTYIDTDGETCYDRVAPICFKEHENEQYLLAITEDDRATIFPVAHITCVSETEARTTFSLPEDFDAERFAQRFFYIEKNYGKTTL